MGPTVTDSNVLDLWDKYKRYKDYAARESLITVYVPLVKYVAGRLAISLPATVQQDDLLSYGIFGLIDAIEKFDLERNVKFETYAIARIRGAIWDGLRAMDWVPYSVRNKAKELEKTYAALENSLGRSATDEEVCQALGMTSDAFHKLLIETSVTSFTSLDEICSFDGDQASGTKILDIIEDKNTVDPVNNIMFEEKKRVLADALNKLPERERLVVALYYYEGLTLKEIGKVLGVSESRISQMHTKAILRLRGCLSRIKKKILD